MKASKEFIAILDYGLSRLSAENLELKKKMIGILIKKTQTLEELMELGNKHQIQSSLYELEQEGFITRLVQKGEEMNIFSYEFNRATILFKIQKELEDHYRKYKQQRDYYTSNVLFSCKKCNKLFEYTTAMENAFQCCGEPMQSFDNSETLKNLTANMTYIEDKLKSFAKI
ncbi:MAG: hypothetical protein LUQ65_14640 [Candidatus Helarchaeota archaeon]|nr:hypothetical protein [Candidatus Helarchaeota archaeon]